MKHIKLSPKESFEEGVFINRWAIVIRYKKPFIRWDKKHYPWKDDPQFTVTKVKPKIFLLPDEWKGHGSQQPRPQAAWNYRLKMQEKILKRFYKVLFEDELMQWCEDKKKWPKNRTYKLFRKWIDVLFVDYVTDMGAGEIIKY
ncbi:MAG: hypothetical protein HY841_04615 [Bacteroidetes bacterium]|nr:hypothetical protein [Bacteroidota bacterium]